MYNKMSYRNKNNWTERNAVKTCTDNHILYSTSVAPLGAVSHRFNLIFNLINGNIKE